MNLKEAFRYQRFLDGIMRAASSKMNESSQCLKTVKYHKRHDANPDAEDMTETVEREYPYNNDNIIALMEQLIWEREMLSQEISKAKQRAEDSFGLNIDTAIETNKFRQTMSSGIKRMLHFSPATHIERGTGYKFNNDGNQAPYYYEIEVATVDDYDRIRAKQTMFDVISRADRVSSEIDSAMINSEVYYFPKWNVNATFDDVLAQFVTSRETTVS